MPETTKPIKALVVGSLNGDIKLAFSKITAINAKHGPFDLVLCPGDFFGSRDDADAAEKALLSGEIKVPLPTYIISGQNQLPSAVTEVIDRNHGEICENLVHLGYSGVMTTIQGLKIAYISGTYDRDVYSATMDSGSPSATHVHYTNGSVRSLCSVPPAPPHVRQGVDILLTVEWPEGIAEGSAVVSKLPKGTDATGIKPIAEIAAALQPRYHFAAEPGVFFQREPYNNRGGAEHVTWFISLGSFGAPNKQRWFYAMNIVPLSQIEAAQLSSRPTNTTPCPLSFGSTKGGESRKRPLDETPDSFFFNPIEGESKSRRRQGRNPPPSTYTCHRCHEAGAHWIDDCPQGLAPRAGYVCRICNVPGHYIKDCPQSSRNSRQSNTRILNRDDRHCWFCLSNPQLERHLIVSIGSEVYLTLAKGALVEGHMLIIPIAHYPSTSQIQTLEGPERTTAEQTLAEAKKFREAIRNAFAERGQAIVCFEIFGGTTEDTLILQHMHIQVVPIPTELSSKLENAFIEEAEAEGLETVEDAQLSEAPTAAHCRVELPTESDTPKSLVFRPSAAKVEEYERMMAEGSDSGRRPPRILNLQFGRKVLAELLGQPERVDWKSCIVEEAEEERLTAEMRDLIKLD